MAYLRLLFRICVEEFKRISYLRSGYDFLNLQHWLVENSKSVLQVRFRKLVDRGFSTHQLIYIFFYLLLAGNLLYNALVKKVMVHLMGMKLMVHSLGRKLMVHSSAAIKNIMQKATTTPTNQN